MNYYRIDTIKSKNFRQCSANGPGIRLIVWCQGCPIHCEGCHNFEIWSFEGGKKFGEDEIEKIIDELKNPLYEGITYLGGEPFSEQNVDGFINLSKKIREEFGEKKTIWGYSGYLYENLIKTSAQSSLVNFLDVLVDGPFLMKEKDLTLRFRGSRNQRLINVQESIKKGSVVLYE